ncbi:armadillo-type protein [Syncephalis plumigaleata]|nr:armadillo-type protein [Syncephalis plumigaleata]
MSTAIYAIASSSGSTSNDAGLQTPFVTNNYLDDSTNRIRTRPVPWEGYQRASLITEAELGLLRGYERRSPDDDPRYASLFISLLQKLVRVDTIQHILVLIDDMIGDDPERARLFVDLGGYDPTLPYAPLLSCLSKDDEYLSMKAAKILTFLVCSTGRLSEQDLLVLINWIISRIKASRNASITDIATQLLASLLRKPSLRILFYNTPHGVSALVDHLRRNENNPQLQYQVVVCIWLLTFEIKVAENIDREHDIILPVINIAKGAIKEKVIRVCVATFRNLVERALAQNITSMLVHRLLPCCEQLASRKFQDADIYDDLREVCEQLQQEFQNLSSFDTYITELEAKRLDWTPVHTSDAFWQENVHRFNDNNYAYLRELAQLLTTSTNHTVLAVAVHDIGQYIKHFPQGKRAVQDIGAKQRIMELMAHDDNDVRYHALVAVQKYMANAW